MLSAKFRFIWPSGVKEELFSISANQKQELPLAAMFVNRFGRNGQYAQRHSNGCFLPSFGSFGNTVSEENIFKESK
jgi:hypothetical protein